MVSPGKLQQRAKIRREPRDRGVDLTLSRQTLVFFPIDPAAGTIRGGLFPEMYYVDKSFPPSDSTNKSMRFGKMGDFLAEFVTGEMNMKMKPLNFQNFQISSLSHLPCINQYPLEV